VDGEVRVRDERDIVYRLPADVARSGSSAPPGSAASAGAVAGAPVLGLDVDERVLFMFSALTYNAHRIHYDRRYTVEVEGHRDLLVHGPLLAIGAVEAARRTRPAEIATVEYRLVAPSYPGSPLDFAADAGEESTAVTGTQDGVTKVQARVTWRT
jgi:3-methylfumaryl-CoA hydratase